jgi:phage-related protein
MKDVGSSVYEICVSEDLSWYRAFYVAKFEDTVHILHAFEKKRNKTSKKDKDAGKKVYNELVLNRKKEAKNG